MKLPWAPADKSRSGQSFARFWTWHRNTWVSLDPMEVRSTLTRWGSSISAPQCGEPSRVGLKPLIHGQGLDLISFIRRIVNILSVKERRDFSRAGPLSTRLGYLYMTGRFTVLLSASLRSKMEGET